MNNFFFVGDKPTSESKSESPKFFTHCEDHGLTRDFKQGVSFRCRPFKYGVTYHNDDFVQDFVILNNSIYMCVVKSTTNVPGESEDWLMVITKGEQGESGLSAYEVWISLGNIGSEIDFINSLKGASESLDWEEF